MISNLALVMIMTFVPPPARADDAKVEAFVKKHARVLKKDEVYYRWQSTTAGENLVRAGVMTEALTRHFDGQTVGISAGPGIYLAGDELSSAMYMPKDGGNIIEVRVPKGTRVLDLEDARVEDALDAADIREKALHDYKGGKNGFLLKYQDDWCVGRNLTGRAHFQIYPGPQHTPDQIAETLIRAHASGRVESARQMALQIRAHRPDAVEAIAARGEVTPALIAVLPPERLAPAVDAALRKASPGDAARVLSALAKSPELSSALAHDPAVLTRALAKFGALDLDPSRHADEVDFLARMARRAPDHVGRPILTRILSRSVRDPWLRRDWPTLSTRLVPILDHVSLTAAERAALAKDIGGALDDHAHNLMHANALAGMTRRAHIEDPDLLARLGAAQVRDQRLLTASLLRDSSSAGAALVDQPDLASFRATVDYLHTAVPSAEVNAAVNQVLKHDPEVLRRLLKTPADFEQAAEVVRAADQAFDSLYQSAVMAGPVERQAFAHACLARPECRPKLINAAALDGGHVFRNPADPKMLTNDLYQVVSKANPAERLLIDRLLGGAARAEDFAPVARAVALANASPRDRALVMQNLRRIGLDQFRAGDLFEITDFLEADDAVKREAIRHAVRTAANADDVVAAAEFAGIHALRDHGFDDEMTRLYRSYQTAGDDVALARRRGLKVPDSPAPAGGECLNILARALGR